MGFFSRRDKDGYYKKGYDESGFNKNGYDKDGYDIDGYDKNGTRLDDNGHCPNCNSTNHSMIIWGLPDSIAIEDHREREDNVIFGGCCVPGDNPPDTSCNNCGHQWRF